MKKRTCQLLMLVAFVISFTIITANVVVASESEKRLSYAWQSLEKGDGLSAIMWIGFARDHAAQECVKLPVYIDAMERSAHAVATSVYLQDALMHVSRNESLAAIIDLGFAKDHADAAKISLPKTYDKLLRDTHINAAKKYFADFVVKVKNEDFLGAKISLGFAEDHISQANSK